MNKKNKKRLEVTSGQGFMHSDEIGKFSVRYGGSEEKYFTSLTEATKFYNSVDDVAAIWDLTKIPELIELKEWVSKKERR